MAEMIRVALLVAWVNFGVWVGPVLVISGVHTYPSYEMFVLMLGLYCLICYNAIVTMWDVTAPVFLSAPDGI